MTRMNLYVPDELAERARAAELNVSGVLQEALRHELAKQSTDAWLTSLRNRPHVHIAHDKVMEALESAREELWGESGD